MAGLDAVDNLSVEDRKAFDSSDFTSISPEGVAILKSITPAESQKRDRTFGEAFSKAKTPEGMAGQLLESIFPLGRIQGGQWISPEEAYGPDWMAASPKKRRAALAYVANKDKEAIANETQATAASTLGDLAGSVLKSPASLFFPVGRSVAAGAASGFSYGAIFDGLEQKTTTDEVDLSQAMVMGGIGAVLGGATNFGISKLTALGEKAAKVKKDPNLVKVSNEKIDEIEYLTQLAHNDGVPTENLPAVVSKEMGVSEDLLRVWTATASRNPNIVQGKMAKIVDEVKVSKGTRGLEDIITPIKSRIAQDSPELAAKLDKYEYRNAQKASELEREATPFLSAFRELPEKAKKQLSLHLMNSGTRGYKAARSYAVSQGMDGAAIDGVQNMLKKVHRELNEAGVERSNLDDYFVRQVKDWEGLSEALGNDGSKLGKMFRQYLNDKKIKPEDVTNSEMNWVVDNFLKAKGTEIQGSRTATRSRIEVRDDLLQYYEDPTVALSNYIGRAADDLAYADFFGNVKKTPLEKRSKVLSDGTELAELDVEGQVTGLLRQMFLEKPQAAARVSELLQTRFNAAREPTNKWVNRARTAGYFNTVANPMSALTQLGDVSVAAVTQGLRPTLSALFSKNQIDVAELGIKSALDADFANTSTFNSALNRAFKWSGFASMDKFGKNTVVNAALNKNKALARKNADKLREKWRPMMGDEVEDLILDLKAGNITERVKLSLFSELADVQPITMSEMPKMYLDHPNGRLFYMLKTFGLKQLDVLRRNVVDEAKKGNVGQAVKFAASYITLFGGMGATITEIKNGLTGRGFHPEDIPDNYISSMLGLFLANRYMGDQIAQGKVTDLGLGMVIPPLDYFDSIARDAINGSIALYQEGGRDLDEIDWKTPGELPVFGPFMGQILDYTLDSKTVDTRIDKDEDFRDSSLSLANPTKKFLER